MIFLVKAIYMELHSSYYNINYSYLSARNDPGAMDKYNPMDVNWIQKTYGNRMIYLLGYSWGKDPPPSM